MEFKTDITKGEYTITYFVKYRSVNSDNCFAGGIVRAGDGEYSIQWDVEGKVYYGRERGRGCDFDLVPIVKEKWVSGINMHVGNRFSKYRYTTVISNRSGDIQVINGEKVVIFDNYTWKPLSDLACYEFLLD